jgi:flavin-binding protein dodecin
MALLTKPKGGDAPIVSRGIRYHLFDRRFGGSLLGPPAPSRKRKDREMPESVYKVVELVGTSPDSWEKAAAAAVARAGESLRDLRIAEISDLDMQITDGKVSAYRAKVKVSFKYEGGD